MGGKLRQQSIRGVKWSVIERFSMQGISFLIINPGFAGQQIVPSTLKKSGKDSQLT